MGIFSPIKIAKMHNSITEMDFRLRMSPNFFLIQHFYCTRFQFFRKLGSFQQLPPSPFGT